MKKFLVVFLLFAVFFVCGCTNEQSSIVLENMSDLRINYFEGNGKDFAVNFSSGFREEVFAYDGVSTPKKECGVISVVFSDKVSYSFISGKIIIDDVLTEVVLEKSPFEDVYMADIERNVLDSAVISFGLKEREELVTLKNLSNDWAVDYKKAVEIATNHLSNHLQNLYFNGKLNAECYLKIVAKNDFEKKFWYFSVIDKSGKSASVLIDVETKEVFDN